MKNVLKSAFGVLAAASVAATVLAPAAVSAWGDSNGGRRSYTIAEINSGVLGENVVLNSISDSTIGDEKNFVGARLDNGDNGAKNVWDGNEITVENDKTYIVRLYVHNNNPNGSSTDARLKDATTAKDVATAFRIPSTSGSTVEVNGVITTSNANPKEYWDNVVFKSADGSKFHLEYIAGSALLENNGIGANGGLKLSDDIIKEAGTKIGYDALDGKIPGCYQFASYVTVKVKAVFDNVDSYTVEKQVRLVGDKEWKESVDAKTGDKVEYQITYKNTSNATQSGVVIKDVLPTNLSYVKGTTKLYNAKYQSGLTAEDTLTTTGINIGSYTAGSNAIVRFTAVLEDKSLECGKNTLNNWAQVTVGKKVLQDSAAVVTEKVCQHTDPVNPDPTPTPIVIPTTGMGDVMTGALGAGSIVTSLGYFIASKKRF